MTEQKFKDNETLLERFRQGDVDAKEQLVLNNMPLVYNICKRFLNRGTDMEDLHQIGAIGLIRAIELFDPGFNVKFSTYAVPMIIGEIKKYLRDSTPLKVSRSYKELCGRVYAAKQEILKKTGEEPGISQIALYLGVSKEDVVASLEAMAPPSSIYAPVGDDEDQILGDFLGDDGIKEDKIIETLALKEVIGLLEADERRIITLRYFQNKTQTQVANDLGISQVSVSRIEKKVLHKMRKLIG